MRSGRQRCFGGTLVIGDELIAFQNLPEFRSVPEVAHAHVFLRPRDEANVDARAPPKGSVPALALGRA